MKKVKVSVMFTENQLVQFCNELYILENLLRSFDKGARANFLEDMRNDFEDFFVKHD